MFILVFIPGNYRQILEKELGGVKHCWGVYEQNSTVNSVLVDDWKAEVAIIASNCGVLTGKI